MTFDGPTTDCTHLYLRLKKKLFDPEICMTTQLALHVQSTFLNMSHPATARQLPNLFQEFCCAQTKLLPLSPRHIFKRPSRTVARKLQYQ